MEVAACGVCGVPSVIDATLSAPLAMVGNLNDLLLPRKMHESLYPASIIVL